MTERVEDAAGLAEQVAAWLRADPRVAAAQAVGQLAWVVPAADWLAPARQKAQAGPARTAVKLWARVFDTAYFAGGVAQPGPSFAGWSSSLTGAPFADAEMELWRQHTVARILALSPRHVLEIGCGLGLLLEKLAPHCATYRATDVSAEAIARLKTWAAGQPALRHVEVAQAAADALDDLPRGTLDTVIINSVVQYFPDEQYLGRVLAAVAPLLAPGGKVFVGDVRDVRLLPAFNAAVVLARAAEDETAAGLRRTLHGQPEPELAVDPRAFAGFSEYRCARTLLKQGGADNEMTRYRYDVVLGVDALPIAAVPSRRWDAATPLPQRTDATPLLLTKIPNGRVAADVQAARRIAAAPAALPAAVLRAQLAAMPAGGEDPAALARAAERCGHRAEALCSADENWFDLLLSDPEAPPPSIAPPAGSPAPSSDPLLARLAAPLLASLRETLAERVPTATVKLVATPALPSSLPSLG